MGNSTEVHTLQVWSNSRIFAFLTGLYFCLGKDFDQGGRKQSHIRGQNRTGKKSLICLEGKSMTNLPQNQFALHTN